jgi:hypothetical protein
MSEPTPHAPADSAAPPQRSAAGLSRWVAPAALLIAVIAIAGAVWALLRQPAAPAAKQPTSQQVADAKARACNAFTTVRSAVSLQTHADLGADPAAVQAVAANARLAMAAGGSHLLAHLDAATPPELAAAMRSLAAELQDIAMNALAGVGSDDPAQAARLRDGEAASGRIAELCR